MNKTLERLKFFREWATARVGDLTAEKELQQIEIHFVELALLLPALLKESKWDEWARRLIIALIASLLAAVGSS